MLALAHTLVTTHAAIIAIINGVTRHRVCWSLQILIAIIIISKLININLYTNFAMIVHSSDTIALVLGILTAFECQLCYDELL